MRRKPLGGSTARPRSIPDGASQAERTTVEVRLGRFGRDVRLVSVSAGWESVGALARHATAHWGVEYDFDGARHERRFADEDSARFVFADWTRAPRKAA